MKNGKYCGITTFPISEIHQLIYRGKILWETNRDKQKIFGNEKQEKHLEI